MTENDAVEPQSEEPIEEPHAEVTPEAVSDPEPGSAAAPGSAPEHEPAPEPASAPVDLAAIVPEVAPASVPTPVAAPVAEPEPASVAEPEVEPAPEPASVAEPAPVPEPVAEPEPGVVRTPCTAPLWPFAVYDGVWAAFCAALVWALLRVPEGPVYDNELYLPSIIAGLALTVAGPVLIVVVWLLCRGRAKGSSGALFVDTLVRGSIATFAGVGMWFVALIIIDQLRLGRIL